MDTATIHFVGLVLFTSFNPYTQRMSVPVSTKNQNQSQIIAIMPRVPYTPTQLKKPSSAKALATTSVTYPTSIVEPHLAALVFEPNMLQSVSGGWQGQVQPLNSQYSQIVLNGEQIIFEADAAAGTPDRSTTGKLQSNGGQLTADYQPPYQGAAAVFHILHGQMNPCKSITQDDQHNTITRYDTELKLANHGTITIKTTDGNKSATFYGLAKIAAVNVPPAWAQNYTPTTSPVPHYKVYCQMIGLATDDVSCPSSLLAAPSCPNSCSCGDAMEIIIHPNGGGHQTTKTTAKQKRTQGGNSSKSSDLFCSTTSWP